MGASGILSLDLAGRTGWAFWEPGRNAPASGVYRLPLTGPDVGRYLSAYRDWLFETMVRFIPETVVFEAPWIGNNTSQDTARKLMGLACVTEMVCYRRDPRPRCFEANNATVRKWWLGKGRGDRKELKRLSIEACRLRGWTPEDDNEADALGLLAFACHRRQLDVPWDDPLPGGLALGRAAE